MFAPGGNLNWDDMIKVNYKYNIDYDETSHLDNPLSSLTLTDYIQIIYYVGKIFIQYAINYHKFKMYVILSMNSISVFQYLLP